MSEKTKRRHHGGDVWSFSRKYGIPVEKIIDFSAPINPFGPPPNAIKAVRKFTGLVRFYPDQNPVDLKRSLVEYVQGIGLDNVIVGNGSVELIYMFVELFARGHEVVIPVPAFTEYERAALRVNAKPVLVQMSEDFSLNVGFIKKAVTDDTRVLIVCNPHSPSGKVFNRELVLDLVDFCYSRGVYILVDENYIDFIRSRQDYTVAPYVNKYENLFVVRSFSKFFGMPGLRLGYGIGASGLIQSLENFRLPWNASCLALVAAKAALEDTKFIEKTMRFVERERRRFAGMLGKISALKVFPSETNFLLIKILDNSITAVELKEKLAEKGISIRSCEDFPGLDNTYFRVSFRTPRENLMLVEALKTIFSKRETA
ncbi:MAG: pyridoxal phosphate-dependent aminotransferase [Candidatus Bathyarchaeales archaeon]